MTTLTAFQESSKLELIEYSSVWNFHGTSLYSALNRKGSNLNNSLLAIRESGYNGLVTLYVTKIGRSQHSKSEVCIFKGVTNLEAVSTSVYYSQRHEEARIDLL
mgnify:FL=1|tara:strand:- start:494 stop:805 length:312 start_codon:yes stop_codon:yes gene_type:complete